MTLFDLIRKEMWHRKSRLISGLLVITLGTAVFVAIRSIALVSEQAVAIKLDNLGANILVLPQSAHIDDYYTADIDAPTFPESYVSRIMNSALPGIDNMSPKLSRRIKVENEAIVLTGILPKSEIASKPLWQKTGLMGKAMKVSCAPKAGSNIPIYKDEKLQRKSIDTLGGNQCLMGASAAKRLHKAEKDTILLEQGRFEISKILPETGTIDDDRVFAHLHTVQQLLGMGGQISSIEIMGCCNEISDGLLAKLRNVVPDAQITTIGQIVSTQIDTNVLLKRLMYAFVLIILVVGGISIGNFMWSNVNERKKEIGVLRMIGYGRKHIYYVLLVKALLLGLIGGVIGFLLGTGIALWLGPILSGIAIPVMPELLLWAIILSVAVALVGAALPTFLAGKMEPFNNLQDN